MKKIVLSGIMAIALIASTSLMAQNVTTSKAKKEAKTEVKAADQKAKAANQETKAVGQKAKATDQKAKEVKDSKEKKVQQTAVNHK